MEVDDAPHQQQVVRLTDLVSTGEITEDGVCFQVDDWSYVFCSDVVEWVQAVQDKHDVETSRSTKINQHKNKSLGISKNKFDDGVPSINRATPLSPTTSNLFVGLNSLFTSGNFDSEKLEAEKNSFREEAWRTVKLKSSQRTLDQYREQFLALLDNRPFSFEPAGLSSFSANERVVSRKNLLDPNAWQKLIEIPEKRVCQRAGCQVCANQLPKSEDPWAELVKVCFYELRCRLNNDDSRLSFFSIENQLMPLVEEHLHKIDYEARSFTGLNWRESILRSVTNKTYWDTLEQGIKFGEKKGVRLTRTLDPYAT